MMTSESDKCEICQENQFKYKCPRCLTKTCSLICCQQHKEDMPCNGLRDKTAYVPMKEYDDMNLLSDYRMLEDMDRSLWQCQKNTIVRRRNRSHFHVRLLKEAHKRGIKLRLLPEGFSKQKANSTMFICSKRCILWHMEWRFPKVNQKISLRRVPEDNILGDELKQYVNSASCSHLLWKDYRDKFDDLSFFIKLENKRPPCYHILDPSKSFNENLKGLMITEFPTIYIVTKTELKNYPTAADIQMKEQAPKEQDNQSHSDDSEPPTKRQKVKDVGNDEKMSQSEEESSADSEESSSDSEESSSDSDEDMSQTEGKLDASIHVDMVVESEERQNESSAHEDSEENVCKGVREPESDKDMAVDSEDRQSESLTHDGSEENGSKGEKNVDSGKNLIVDSDHRRRESLTHEDSEAATVELGSDKGMIVDSEDRKSESLIHGDSKEKAVDLDSGDNMVVDSEDGQSVSLIHRDSEEKQAELESGKVVIMDSEDE